MVTTQLEGSDFDDESDFEDSEEDWQPAKGEQKGKKIKSPGRAVAKKSTTPASKNGAKKRGRKPPAAAAASRKSKKKAPSSEEEDEPEVSEEDEEEQDFDEPEPAPSPAKKVKATPKKELDAGGQTSVTPVSIVKAEPTTSVASTKPVPLQRKVVTPVKSFPDKFGFLNLYIFKGDLKEGIVNNPQVCLWRRDGSSLLQKYLRDKTVNTDLPQYNSSMVYSCWEDKRANEYIEVKVRCIEQSKQVRVELTNVDELEVQSRTEYESYVAEHGVPEQRTSTAGNSQDGTDDDDDEDEEYGDNEGEEGEESEAEEE